MYSQLEAILVNTYAADRNLRMQSEADLKSFLQLSNAFNGFLGMCMIPNMSTNIKMAAALTLKNNARNFWQRKSPLYNMTDDEKTLAKTTLMSLLIAETKSFGHDTSKPLSIYHYFFYISLYSPLFVKEGAIMADFCTEASLFCISVEK